MKLAVLVLSFCVAALLALGMVMLYSASMTQVGAHYLIMQSLWCALGLALCAGLALLDYRVLRKLAIPLLVIAVAMLALVLVPIPDITRRIHGARRWFFIHGVSFQPSEFGKLALIIAVAWYGSHFQRQMSNFKRGILIPGIFIGLVLGLIFIEPDRGSTILLAAISGAMLLIAGVRWRFIFPPIVAGAAGLAFSILHDPVRMRRIFSWLDLEQHKEGGGYQAYQAMLALGSGGWTGLGLGNSRQKLGFVIFQQSDFILPIIGEELGLVATLLIVVAFLAIVICGFYIAMKSRDAFGMLLASGVTLLIGLQAAINIGVVTNALPNKGLPLPFISYGGTNLVAMLACVGLLLSVARQTRLPESLPAESVASGELQPA
jgi:cell division protein FtsW